MRKSDWISVEERLPNIYTDVWVWVIYADGIATGTESWRDPSVEGKLEWAMGSAKGYRVTHWQPLPAPPTKGADKND